MPGPECHGSSGQSGWRCRTALKPSFAISTRRCSSSEVTMIHWCPSGGRACLPAPAARGTAGDAGSAHSINYTAPDALIAVMKPFSAPPAKKRGCEGDRGAATVLGRPGRPPHLPVTPRSSRWHLAPRRVQPLALPASSRVGRTRSSSSAYTDGHALSIPHRMNERGDPTTRGVGDDEDLQAIHGQAR